jgi:hypothetical protein
VADSANSRTVLLFGDTHDGNHGCVDNVERCCVGNDDVVDIVEDDDIAPTELFCASTLLLLAVAGVFADAQQQVKRDDGQHIATRLQFIQFGCGADIDYGNWDGDFVLGGVILASVCLDLSLDWLTGVSTCRRWCLLW